MRRLMVFLGLVGLLFYAVACSKTKAETHVAQGVAAASSAQAADSLQKMPLPAVVFLGDSLTAGRGLAESQAMPALIAERVKSQGLSFNVINAGRSGDTTAGGRSRLSWYFRESVNAQVLVIGLGSNDAMRGQPLASTEENLKQIIRAARAAQPDVVIYLWELKTFPNMGSDYGDAYEELFRRVAEVENVELLPFPLADVAGKPELNQADGIHPTAEGTRLVADRIWRFLLPRLRELAQRRSE